MENPDLRKASIDALKSIKGELEAAVVIVTDCDKTTALAGGDTVTLINMLAGAMVKDANIFALIHTAILAAAEKMETE